jgi:fumarylpyruvate hydrolase
MTIGRRDVLKSAAVAVAGGTTAATLGTHHAVAAPVVTVVSTVIPIIGTTDVFPVRRIYCIGRNYAAHAREMGSDPTREPPFFFQKPTDAIQNVAVGAASDHPYPPLTKNYHYEVELVAALKSGGRNISKEQALDHEKKPWEIGKSFDQSAPIGPLHPVTKVGHFANGAISLTVNGTIKQKADLSFMIWSVAEQIARLSEAFELKAGDVIYSGTPENVGPVVKGDVLVCAIERLPEMSIRIV